MLRLFSRTISTTASALKTQSRFIPRTSHHIIRNMGDGKASNDQLKGSRLFDVSHVTALVTGGGTGIGLMITQALVANGAKVYITSRRDEVLRKTDELYDSGPGQIIPLQGDVRYIVLHHHTRNPLLMSTQRQRRRSTPVQGTFGEGTKGYPTPR